METVFGHGITDKEVIQIFGFELSKEEYIVFTDDQLAIVHLGYLYNRRKDKKKVKDFIFKLSKSAILTYGQTISHYPE